MNRNELNRTNTIEDIKKSFIKIYEVGGIDKVTIKKICETAGISKTIFYRYFEDKYQVLEVIEKELLDNVKEINVKLDYAFFNEYKKGTPFPVFFETAQYIQEQGLYFKALLGPYGDPSFIFRWKKLIKSDIRRKFELDKITTYNLDAVGELCAGGIIGLYTLWFYEKPEMTAEEISEIGGTFVSGSFYNFK